MRARTFRHARDALAAAETHQKSLCESRSFADFDGQWRAWLRAVQRVWNKLEAVCHGHPNFQKLRSQHVCLERADPLLSYIKIARDVEEHSVAELTDADWTTALVAAPGADRVSVSHMKMGPLQIRNLTFIGQPGTTIVSAPGLDPAAVEFDGTGGAIVAARRVRLLPVENRGKRVEPPDTHVGSHIEPRSVLRVVELAMRYFSELLARAEETCAD